MTLDKEALVKEYPVIQNVLETQPLFWCNPNFKKAPLETTLSKADIFDAAARLTRFRPYIQAVFPDTFGRQGQIESSLKPLRTTRQSLSEHWHLDIPEKLFLKADNQLPISGHISARGGIYAVLKATEDIAMQYSNLAYQDDYAMLTANDFTQLFSHFEIVTAANGALGLSVARVARKLGFKVTIYLTDNTEPWLQQLIQETDAQLLTQQGTLDTALTAAKDYAQAQDNAIFIDSLNDVDLLLGYSTAALHLQMQLKAQHILVDKEHPLYLYLPADNGLSVAGLLFGSTHILGPNVYPIITEPVQAPTNLLALITGAPMAITDLGLNGQTLAKRLVASEISTTAFPLLKNLTYGATTATDAALLKAIYLLATNENSLIDPAGIGGFIGLQQVLDHGFNQADLARATHVVWATGGRFVPKNDMAQYINQGETYLNPKLDDFIKF